MNHIHRMHIGQSFQKLIHKQSDNFRLKSIRRFLKDFKKIVLNVLKYKIDNSFFSKGLFKFYNVRMLQHFEYFDLSHGGFLNNLIFFWFFKLFDGYNFFIIITLAFEYNSIGSLAYHAHNIILLHINFYHYNPYTINFNLKHSQT